MGRALASSRRLGRAAAAARRQPHTTRRALAASAVAARRSARRKPSPRTLPSMPLGLPLPPADEHAISASMPLWSHVVGYEEGDAYIHEQLTLGYPRFVYHPSVRELFDYVEDTLGNGEEAMVVFPSAAAAVRCQAFVERALAGVRADQPRVDPPRHSRLVAVFDEPPPEGTMELTAVALPCDANHASSHPSQLNPPLLRNAPLCPCPPLLFALQYRARGPA
jgi:hypothetical protein